MLKVGITILLLLSCVGVGCQSPTPTPTPAPTPTPLVCESDRWAFEKKGLVSDDYYLACVQEGGYYIFLTLKNETANPFKLTLRQGAGDEAIEHALHEEGTRTLDDSAVTMFEVCSSDCQAVPGWIRIEVDAPNDDGVEWAVRAERKDF